MPEFLMCIPPISQINFPYIAGPTLKAVLDRKGFSTALSDANILFFKYFQNRRTSLFKDTDLESWNDLYLNCDPLSIDDEFTISWVQDTVTPEMMAVGFSVVAFTAYPWTLQAAVIIKKLWPHISVILGGAFFDADVAEQTLLRCRAIDAVAVGESEHSLTEYLSALKRHDLAAAGLVGGFAVRKENKKVILNTRTQGIENERSTPAADFQDLPLDDYLDYRIGTRILPILGSRGCVGSCVFCSEKRIWGKMSFRRPDEIVMEIAQQIKRHKANVFRFNDSLLNADPKHLETLCDLLIEKNLGVHWACNVRIHKNLSPPIFDKMRRAGCRQLWFGFESGSQRVLNLMKKAIHLNIAGKILKQAKEADMMVLLFLIAEFPGERWVDTKETIDFLETNSANIDAIHISEYKLIKNSEMFINPDKFGIVVEDLDQFGVPIWAINTHTTRNLILLEQVNKHLWGRPEIPWPVVGGI